MDDAAKTHGQYNGEVHLKSQPNLRTSNVTYQDIIQAAQQALMTDAHTTYICSVAEMGRQGSDDDS